MTSVEILFISFLLFLTSWAKPFKESTNDNENTSHAIQVTLSALENDEESIYIRKDDILSISEFSKSLNPQERHLNDLNQFIKETDSTYDKTVSSENNKTKSELPELKEFNEENKTDRSVDATTIDSREALKESKSDELLSDITENESTTISIIGQDKTGEFEERYDDDLEIPENVASTEGYSKTAVSDDDMNSDKLEDTVPLISSRRSLSQDDQLLLDYRRGSNTKPVVVIEVEQDTIPTSKILSVEKQNEQSKIEKESKDGKSEEISSETYEIESSTISIKGQGKTGELIAGYEDEIEVPDNDEPTEGTVKTVDSNDETNNKKLDEIVPPIPSRRSIFQNNKQLLDSKGRINEPIEFVEVDQNTVPKSESISFKRSNEQSKIESNEGISSVLVPQPRNPYPVTSFQQFYNPPPHLPFRRTIPAVPDEYKQSDNLDKSGDVWNNERSIKEINPSIFENAYPYMLSNVNSPNQEPSTREANLNSLYLKLSEASEHPLRSRSTGGVSLGDAETPSMASQLIYPHPVTPQQQVHGLPQHLTFRRTIPANFGKIPNEDRTNFGLLKLSNDPDEYKHTNNVGKSAEMWTIERGIENLNSNIHETSLPHTHSNVISQQQLSNKPNFSSFYSKLNQDSEHHLRHAVPSGLILGNHGPIHKINNRQVENLGPNNFGTISRRLLLCNNCRQTEHNRH